MAYPVKMINISSY